MIGLVLATQLLVASPRAAAETDPVATDKVAHAAVSYAVTLTGAILLEKLDLERWQAVAIASGASLLLGLGKEYLVDSEASGGDLLADVVGTGLAAGLVFTFEL